MPKKVNNEFSINIKCVTKINKKLYFIEESKCKLHETLPQEYDWANFTEFITFSTLLNFLVITEYNNTIIYSFNNERKSFEIKERFIKTTDLYYLKSLLYNSKLFKEALFNAKKLKEKLDSLEPETLVITV